MINGRNTRFASTYSYHHGYFDGSEREFRGFGRVEQVDVESFGNFQARAISEPNGYVRGSPSTSPEKSRKALAEVVRTTERKSSVAFLADTWTA